MVKWITGTAGLLVYIGFIVFYYIQISPYTQELEDWLAAGTAALGLILLAATLITPQRLRILAGIFLTLFLAVTLVNAMFWLVRPYQMVYQDVPERMDMLEEHLEEEYPGRSFDISQSPVDEDPLFLFFVEFDDEPGYVYYYYMDRDTAEGESPIEPDGGHVQEEAPSS
ncbi:hypothetical protein [Alkalicoccus chagannorensis]|uniref:hypothetical protein n=1 Tax=Alkalicoccus chagannorensis TaxID=427072 RepID=UPI00040860BB|nr:hypothetical protein [Alkalicoccus chagannorensis]